jgi:GTP-dependent dephospho-CoA kinase
MDDLRPRRAYTLPVEVRGALAQPFGPVVSTQGVREATAGASFLVAVGDVVSLTLLEVGLVPRFFVCDYHTQRGRAALGAGPAVPSGPVQPLDPALTLRTRLHEWGRREVRVRNPAGHVTREAWDAIRAAMADAGPAPLRIVVEGEEDLLGLPCFLEAPVGAAVLYGMPGQGVVVVHVTPELQASVANLVRRLAPT